MQASEAAILLGGAAGDTERALLKTRVGHLLRRMCSLAAADDEPVALTSKILTLSAAALPRVERLRVPLPAADRTDENGPPGEDEEDSAAGDDENLSAYVREPFAIRVL